MRDEGEGVPRIFEEMQESLLKQPEITVQASRSLFCCATNQRRRT